ncbi:hypothetical protein MW887_000102 [Aspergillus wentii]|nr:hypothetical protein MW887_000102 [Aspergillus wentii]
MQRFRRAFHLLPRAQARLASSSALKSDTQTRPDDFFHYTSGRWLFDEQQQLAKRHVKFNPQALQKVAGQLRNTQCVQMTKLPEGMHNKVFSLKMENGEEILARIPNPNAGHPRCVVSSEVATLDFLRSILGLPVPTVLDWSSVSNPVGAAYILMEKAKGRQLSEVRDTMSTAQKFGLVKRLVEIERRLVSTRFARHGSLYYKDSYPDGNDILDSTEMPKSEMKAISKFVVGPTTEISFWEDERRELDIDRGPWKTTEEYLTAIAHREIAVIRKLNATSCLDKASPEKHIQLLEQFMTVLPYILPFEDVSNPVLLHHDLHTENIFVDETDHTKVSSIIDWQEVYAAPLFLQARFPSVFDCDDPYPWGIIKPELPDDFDILSQPEKNMEEERLDRLRLKKFYEIASRKFNPALVQAMDAMADGDDPTTFIFHLIGHSAANGPSKARNISAMSNFIFRRGK